MTGEVTQVSEEKKETNSEDEEDKYKDYYTTNIFEGLKKADPRVLTAVGIVAVILVIVIILVFGGGQA